MRRIAAEIREQTGLTCSIGIAESRMLAKITSELGKPAGLVVLSREQALERFGGDSPGLVPGIGPKTVAKLRADGHRRPWPTLRDRDLARLESAFGPRMGGWLRSAGAVRRRDPDRGLAQDQVAVDRDDLRHRRRRPRRGSAESLRKLAEELCRRLHTRDLEGRTIGIKVRLDDWTTVTRSHTVERATNDPGVVVPAALDLLRAYAPPRPVRLLGVRMAGFAEDESDPGAAEADPDERQLRLGVAG